MLNFSITQNSLSPLRFDEAEAFCSPMLSFNGLQKNSSTIPNEFSEDITKESKAIKDLVVKFKRDWSRVVSAYKKIFKKSIDKHSAKTIYNKASGTFISGERYSSADDEAIIVGIKQFGHNWIKISESLPGRNPLSLRNRYYNMIKYKKIPTVPETSCKERQEDLSLKIDEIKLDENPKFLELINKMIEEIGH